MPKKEKKLSKDEGKKVKGGVDGSDFLTWRRGVKAAQNLPS